MKQLFFVYASSQAYVANPQGLYLILVNGQHGWIVTFPQFCVAAVPYPAKSVAGGAGAPQCFFAADRWPC
jgi:hypothetical protein